MFWVTVATFFFPGFAQGLVHRYKRFAVWASVAIALLAAGLWEPRCLWLVFVVHFAGAIDGYRCYRRDARMGTNRAAAALAVVISTVVGGAIGLQGEVFRIPASSSCPMLQIGEDVIANKLEIKLFGVHRGELVAYVYPCDRTRTYLSRVVALAGDSVAVACGALYVNGTAVPRARIGDDTYIDRGEDYRPEEKHTTRYRETIGDVTHDMYIDDRGPGVLVDFPRAVQQCYPSGVVQGAGRIIDPPVPPKRECDPHKLYVVPPGHVFVMGDNRSNAHDSRVWGSLPIENVIGRITGIWWSRSLGRIGPVD
jgi:signal peptidase I